MIAHDEVSCTASAAAHRPHQISSRFVREIRGCCASAVAVLTSGVGTASRMFKLKEDLLAMLQSAGSSSAARKQQGSVANMNEPATQLVDEAVKMGARIVSVELN
jgi:hypothetical protein